MRDTPNPPSNGRRRICFVLETAHQAFTGERMIGGAETQIRTVGECLVERGHGVWVASARPFEHPTIGSLTTDRLWSGLRALRPDLVVATVAMRRTVEAAVVSRLLGLEFVYRVASTEESRYRITKPSGGDPLSRLALYLMLHHLTARIWCQHDEQQRNFEHRRLGHKAFVAFNLVPDRRVPGIRDGARDTDPRAPDPRDTVLWVGRFDVIKGPDLFLDLARRLTERRCLMICPGVTDAFRAAAATLDHVEILDYVPPEELAPHYARARVLVNTSSREGSPNTFIEAACQGTPVVTAGLDPGGFFARFGFGRAAEGIDAMVDAVEALFDDPEHFTDLSTRARRYFEEVHDLDRQFPRLERQLLGAEA